MIKAGSTAGSHGGSCHPGRASPDSSMAQEEGSARERPTSVAASTAGIGHSRLDGGGTR